MSNEKLSIGRKITDYFSKWTIGQYVYVVFWLLTAIFLIVTIALFVVWQTSMLEYTTINDNKFLTDNAIYQQNVTAAITFTTVVLLIGAVFSTTIESYLKRKRNRR